jgi:hypothetical protein
MEEEASEEEEEVEDILKSGAQPQWHERQRVWQALGLFVGSAGGLAALTGAQPLLVGLFNSALSSSTTVALAAVNPVAALGWTVGGAAAIALGAKMWHRRCYNDPEAVRVYYADFCRAGFLAAVARHDFDNLLRIATREGMTTKLLEEMAAAPYAGFDAVWHAYGAAHLTQMVDKRVLTRDYLRAKLARDFDPELAHTMPDDGVLVLVDLMRGMKTYGRWVVEWLEVSPAWIRHRLAHDARVCGLSFSQFVKEGGMALHPTAGASRLISRVQLRDMFFRELGHKEWTFKVALHFTHNSTRLAGWLLANQLFMNVCCVCAHRTSRSSARRGCSLQTVPIRNGRKIRRTKRYASNTLHHTWRWSAHMRGTTRTCTRLAAW